MELFALLGRGLRHRKDPHAVLLERGSHALERGAHAFALSDDALVDLGDLLRAEDRWGRGANLGWNRMEGLEPFRGATEPEGHHRPITTYGREGGRCSVTGGVVHRGPSLPDLDGVYLFGDLCTGELWGRRPTADGVAEAPLTTSAEPGSLVSFGEDAEGEVYVVELSGRVSRLAAA